VRMVGLAALVGLAVPAIYTGNGALIFVTGICSYLIGLDILEPLAQAVDHVDRTDATPLDRGLFFQRHLPASAVACVLFSAITAVIAVLSVDTSVDRNVVLVASPLVLLTGLAGAVISVMMGAPEQTASAQVLPPEMMGAKIAIRAAWPFIIAVLGAVPLLMAERARSRNADAFASFLRSAILIAFLIAFVAVWVRQRDATKAWWQQTMKDSQAQAAARRKQA
jgi:membrane-associated HD superfamily phosphohydrolase